MTKHHEGKTAKAIEEETAKIPSDMYLWASAAAMATSLGFKLCKRPHTALFIGQWAAPFLLFGIYNKIVKTLGSDGSETESEQETETEPPTEAEAPV